MNPIPPFRHHEPQQVNQDTFIIRDLTGEPYAPMFVYINSFVIRGKEPVVVDTGTYAHREQFFKDVFSLVDPEEIKWIILSHDDSDHTGNLRPLLEAAPNATLVANWFMWERMSGEIALPIERMRWIDDGGSLDVGDRTLHLVRPPIFDSPTTRGVFDSKTGFYWASDAFASPVLSATENVAELDEGFWQEGFAMFQRAVSPWHGMLDERKFNVQVNRVAALEPKVIASAHTPPITGKNVDRAISMMRLIPGMEAVQLPGQDVLDAMVQEMNNASEETAKAA
jgi:flavorubredoxin